MSGGSLLDRIARRRDGLRRRRWFRVLLVVLGMALVGAIVWLVWFSSVLAARSVEIDGQVTLKAEQIREVAEVPVGTPLARVDLTAIEARVREMPRVRVAEVSRSWPTTIRIEISERSAVLWMSVEGEFHGIDRFGVDYRTYPQQPKTLIEGVVTTTDPDARLAALRSVAQVSYDLRVHDPELRAQVQRIIAGSRDSVVLDLTEGRTVTWGSPDDPERKVEVLDTLLQIDAKDYDVSAPDQPTTQD